MTAPMIPAESTRAAVIELLAGDVVATTPHSPPYTLAAAPGEPVYGQTVDVAGDDGITRHYHARAWLWLVDCGSNPTLQDRRAGRAATGLGMAA